VASAHRRALALAIAGPLTHVIGHGLTIVSLILVAQAAARRLIVAGSRSLRRGAFSTGHPVIVAGRLVTAPSVFLALVIVLVALVGGAVVVRRQRMTVDLAVAIRGAAPAPARRRVAMFAGPTAMALGGFAVKAGSVMIAGFRMSCGLRMMVSRCVVMESGAFVVCHLATPAALG
jgi:hypothetical protein